MLDQEKITSKGLRGIFLSDNDRRDPRQAEIEDIAIELEDDTLDPRQLMHAMDRLLPDDAVITLGAGQFWPFPVRFISGRKSRRFICSYDFGSISHSMPVAIGASIALGKRSIFVVEGGASLIMSIQELDTIARKRVPWTERIVVRVMHFIADRRCTQLAPSPVFAETDNPCPWMSEAMERKKEKNFLDARDRVPERRHAELGMRCGVRSTSAAVPV